MPLSSERTTIGEVRYEVTKLPYKAGRKVLLRLYKVAGPALARAVALAPEAKGKRLLDLDLHALAPAISALVEKLAETLTEEDLDFIVDQLASYTTISRDGEKWPALKTEMDFLFSGNYGDWIQWLGFALRVNFGGFFDGPAWVALREKAVQGSPFPTTSTGQSTG